MILNLSQISLIFKCIFNTLTMLTKSRSSVSEFCKGQIIGLKNHGVKICEIARTVGLNRSTVDSVIRAARKKSSQQTPAKRGRKLSYSERELRYVKNQAVKERKLSLGSLAHKLGLKSKSTIRRMLASVGFKNIEL